MARKKKKPAARKSAKNKTRAKARPAKKKPTRKSAKSPPKRSKANRGSEVEKLWNAYLKQRSELELAVEDVRSAESALAEARDHERTVRKEFDAAKSAFEQMLEVEPASSSRPSHRRRVEEVPLLANSESMHD